MEGIEKMFVPAFLGPICCLLVEGVTIDNSESNNTPYRWVGTTLVSEETVVYILNRISGVMVNVLVSSAVDRGFELWSGQTKDY